MNTNIEMTNISNTIAICSIQSIVDEFFIDQDWLFQLEEDRFVCEFYAFTIVKHFDEQHARYYHNVQPTHPTEPLYAIHFEQWVNELQHAQTITALANSIKGEHLVE
jgi:hypothetical protein